jgi:multidrug resistance efflux pump
VKSGASAEDIAISQARVDQARAAVESARAARDQAVLKAPFDGTVSALNIHLGEAVGAGMPMLILADLSTLQIETTDLNELDVARLTIGDQATITFDALPDITIEGEVISIAPKAAEGAGVNYAVIIKLNELPDALRWGMTAFVEIETD